MQQLPHTFSYLCTYTSLQARRSTRPRAVLPALERAVSHACYRPAVTSVCTYLQAALDELEATLEAQRQTSAFLAKALRSADTTQLWAAQRALEAQDKARDKANRRQSRSDGTPGRRRRRERSEERGRSQERSHE